MPRSNESTYFSETQNDQDMKPLIDTKSIKTLKYSDYRKALKRDRKWLPKGQAIIFLGQYRFADNKKGLGVLIFKKLAAAKQVFKELKKGGVPTPKIAIGSYQLEKESSKAALKVNLLRGGLSMEKIKLEGKLLFSPLWKVDMKFGQAQPNASDTTDNTGMATQDETKAMGSSMNNPVDHSMGMGGDSTMETTETERNVVRSSSYEAFTTYQKETYPTVLGGKHPSDYQAALEQVKIWLTVVQGEGKAAPKNQQASYKAWAKEIYSFGLAIKTALTELLQQTNEQKTQLQQLAKQYMVQGKRYKKGSSPGIQHEAWKALQIMQQELRAITPHPSTEKAHQQLTSKLDALLATSENTTATQESASKEQIDLLKGRIQGLLGRYPVNKNQLKKAS